MTKYLNKKVKAGALQYVLVIAIIIFIILFAFIQLVSLQQKLSVKKSLYQKAILQADNGFRYLSIKNIKENTVEKVKFSENEQEEVVIEQKYWGIFDRVIVTSKVNKEIIKKVALLGNEVKNRKAIYLVDNNTSLVLVGNSKIVGTSYLSHRGVKSGNIAGHSFYGTSLIQGETRRSSTNLPKNERLKKISERFFINKEIEPNLELNSELKIVQSFYNETLYYRDYQTIQLEEISLKGNIVITSDTKIIVKKTAVLEDVILIAPEIEIQSGFKGNVQAFSTKRIHIEESVKLKYPSALIMTYKNQKIENEDGIFIDTKSDVKGVIVFLKSDLKEKSFWPQIKIKDKVQIIGEIYCEGNIELLGNVTGEVYTDNFVALQSGSKYINHIYNGNINTNNLVDQYVGLGVQTKEKSIAKWLY
ncbi:hypothetical protein ACSIGC_05030 [Tenacibaculum sp. ZS6-P6]|uniref:hypothetical protein n=1 Tax=Tenacibaculum sp. ZS6-P6 TaxID=3447503 RepID=UPI003F99F37F